MLHHHLRLKLIDQVVADANHNDDRRAAEPDGLRVGDRSDDHGQQGDNDQEQGIEPIQAAGSLSDKLAGRTAGANTGDVSAILLQIV